ncbi:MAG: DUF5723 family protein [Bacteroidales bacterium]|nr:DUF5723 family protein [Bacteroidales bacterium]
MRTSLLTFVMGLLVSTSVAQNVTPVDFMRNNPRSVYANPASYIADYGYFDMFLGNVNLSLQNIGLKYDNFFQFNSIGQPIVADLHAGVASMRKNNYLNSFANVDLFSCGRATKNGYLTFSYRFREMESFRYNKEFMELVVNGNGSFVGADNPANADIALALRAYQEISAGYQMSLLPNLNVGARLKFLMGYGDAKSSAFNLQLITDEDTYAWTATGVADLLVTLPYEASMQHGVVSVTDSRFNIDNLFRNYGAGIDLGAEYMINRDFGISAAINDLGFIRWNHFAAQYHGGVEDAGSMYEDGALVFSGLTEAQIMGFIEDPHYMQKFVDTVRRYFDMNSTPLKGYTSGLNTSFMVRGYYDWTIEHRFLAQLTGYCSGIGLRPAMTLAYSGAFADNYDIVASYTMMPGSYDNLGLGLSANFGGFLIYVASNNVIGFFDPANISGLNFQFGISFTGGGKIDRDDKIVLKD